MLVVYAFTLTAFVAVFLHSWYVTRVFRYRIEVASSHEPAYVLDVARALQHMETVRFLINFLLLVAGLGIIAGGPFRMLGYLLALIPVLSVLASYIALRRL